MEDISIITILAGPVSTYLTEEIESTVESVVAYVYSSAVSLVSKKRLKLISTPLPTGDIVGAVQLTHNFLRLNASKFKTLYKPLDMRTMWQDPTLSRWEGAADRRNLTRLGDRYKW